MMFSPKTKTGGSARHLHYRLNMRLYPTDWSPEATPFHLITLPLDNSILVTTILLLPPSSDSSFRQPIEVSYYLLAYPPAQPRSAFYSPNTHIYTTTQTRDSATPFLF